MAKIIIILVAVVVLAGGLISARMRWLNHVASLKNQVLLAEANPPERVDLAEVQSLPSPVKRYFEHVLKDGQPIIAKASLSQRGGFKTSPEAKAWSKMTADQVFATAPKGFVWDSSIALLPGLSINVCDSYIDGQGAMKGKVAALVSVIDVGGEAKLSQGALQRYLAEAVWFPTALLPSQGVVWEEVSPNVARATITDEGLSVSLDFEFNAEGEAIAVFSPARYREVQGVYEPTPVARNLLQLPGI